MGKITKQSVLRYSKPNTSGKNYFRMSVKCFVKTILFMALGIWYLANRTYGRLTKIAVLVISFALVVLLSIAWLNLLMRTIKRALQRLFGSVIVYS